jgi:tetratricopeptide (TPR) repeat protein
MIMWHSYLSRATARLNGRTAIRANDLGIDYFGAYEGSDRKLLLNAAVAAFRDAASFAPENDERLPVYQSNLGMALVSRYLHQGDPADLDEAIDACHLAITATPGDHPDLGLTMSNLGNALRMRFLITGDPVAIDEAVSVGRESVALTSETHYAAPGGLSNLGSSLVARFEVFGTRSDIDDAITAYRKAGSVAGASYFYRAEILIQLAHALRLRFEFGGEAADLDQAIASCDDAVAARAGLSRASSLTVLASVLAQRFGVTEDVADLDAAVSVSAEALSYVPTGHSERATYVHNHAQALLERFMATGDEPYLEAATKACREAVKETPANRTVLAAACYSALSTCLSQRYARTGDFTDSDAAIDAGTKAIVSVSTGSPHQARYLSNRGIAWFRRFESSGQDADLTNAVADWTAATAITSSPPQNRLMTAAQWGAREMERGRPGPAVTAYSTAVMLLSQAAWRGLTRSTREKRLADWAGIACDAAASALADAEPRHSVELLEQGRSVLWHDALNLWTDLARLESEHPELAQSLDRVRLRLSVLDTDSASSPGSAREAGLPSLAVLRRLP